MSPGRAACLHHRRPPCLFAALLACGRAAIRVVVLEKALAKLVTSPSPLKANAGRRLLLFPLYSAQSCSSPARSTPPAPSSAPLRLNRLLLRPSLSLSPMPSVPLHRPSPRPKLSLQQPLPLACTARMPRVTTRQAAAANECARAPLMLRCRSSPPVTIPADRNRPPSQRCSTPFVTGDFAPK